MAAPPPSDQPAKPDRTGLHVILSYAIGSLLVVVAVQWLVNGFPQIETIPYSQFDNLVARGQVSEARVGQNTIEGSLRGCPEMKLGDFRHL